MPLLTLFQKKETLAPSRDKSLEDSRREQGEWSIFEEGQLLIDMVEVDDAIIVRALVAGIEPEQLEISLHNDMLTIRGNRQNQQELYDDQYLVRECYWGSFSRSVIIPIPVQTDAIQATFKNGVVTITLPKSEHTHTIPLTEQPLSDSDDESPYWEDGDQDQRP